MPASSEEYRPLLRLTCSVMAPEPQPVASEHVKIHAYVCIDVK